MIYEYNKKECSVLWYDRVSHVAIFVDGIIKTVPLSDVLLRPHGVVSGELDHAYALRFPPKTNVVSDIIATCLADVYLQFGLADDGQADYAAERILEALEACEYTVVKSS